MFTRSRNIYQALFTLLLIIPLMIGVFTLNNYGESWDELKFYKYADTALSAYHTWPARGAVETFGNTYDNYGPAYSMGVVLLANALHVVFHNWLISDLRHFIYFITFLIGIWAFYKLAERWLAQTAALGATLLFATQPLFWGHAFVGPKDIPFLTFFLLSLLSGLRLFDELKPISLTDLSPRAKRTLLASSAFWLVTVILLFTATNLIHARIESIVRAAGSGETNIVSFIASDVHKVKPEIYIQKYFVYFLWARSLFFLLSSFIVVLLHRKLHPSSFILLISILPSAILLGFTTSIRILGPLAGLIVTLYALRNKGRQAIIPLFLYAFIALIAVYLTWPYLWPNPIGRFVESLRVMSQYPWHGQVLFNGIEYQSTNIPLSYLPTLLAIQLTEPVWILFAIGSTVTAIGFAQKREESRQLLALSVIWFILPLLFFIFSHSPLYDNFRQIFFILPPVFLLAGVVFEKIKKPSLQVALIALVILPGIVDGIRLHPYEYMYYNRFAGGVGGVFRKYELDYWGISYREAAEYVNTVAPANAKIWVEGPAHLPGLYLRPDIKVYSTYEAERADHYDYVIAMTRYDLDLKSYPDAKIVHPIERDGAILTVIKQP